MSRLKSVFLALFCIAILIHIVPTGFAIDPTIACCVPKEGTSECIGFNADRPGAFGDFQGFKNMCDSMPGLTSSNVACSGLNECKVDCCCATSDVTNSASVNSDEKTLQMTRYACNQKNTTTAHYKFSMRDPANPAKDTCVEVCGGTAQSFNQSTWKVSGKAFNTTSGTPVPMAGVKVFIPVPEGPISNTTNEKGEFTIQGVPQITTNVFGISGCGPAQSEPILVNADIKDVKLNFNCNQQVCMHSAPSISAPTAFVGGDNLSFTISYEDKCKDMMAFIIKRNDQPIAVTTNKVFVDKNIQNNTKYCYSVVVQNSDGTTINMSGSGLNCITTGDYDCMHLTNNTPSNWCGMNSNKESIIVSCNANNVKQSTICPAKKVCAFSNNDVSCISAAECEKCNGILGFFASLNLKVPIGDQGLAYCQNLQTTCYVSTQDDSSTPTMINMYDSCKYVSGCTSYTTESICNTNPCKTGTNQACQWRNISEELGTGICVTKNKPECSACNNLGFCNKAACQAISDECYYDEFESVVPAKGCINKKDMACAYYDTKQDCVGTSPNASYDISYSATTRRDAFDNIIRDRIGGTNKRVSSDDLLDIGACTWIEEGGYCIKNADNMFMTSPPQDDCEENNNYDNMDKCLQDSTPPNTTLFLINNTNPPIYSRAAINVLPFSVIDDKSSFDQIRTFVCLDKSGNSCYPTSELGLISIPAPGTYTLRYYSMDASQNSEPIKSVRITFMDYHEASLINMTIKENR